MQENFDSEMSDAMSELATILYRIGAEPHEIRSLSKFLLQVAQTHYKSLDSDDELGS